MFLVKHNKLILVIVSFLAFLGFLDGVYLTISFYVGKNVPCSIFDGCEKVLSSKYAHIYDVPLSLIGAIYYFVLFILFVLLIFYAYQRALKLAFITVVFGFFVSLGLLYIQLFILKAICFYCAISFVLTLLILMLTIMIYRKSKYVVGEIQQ